MILEWIHKMLSRQLDRKKKDVVRLRWQQAELQRQLDTLKRQQSEK